MKFKEALISVFNSDRDGNDCFYTYCMLSDLCGNSFGEGEKIKLFYKLDKKLKIVFHLKDSGALAVPVLKAAYPAVKTMLKKESFISLIEVASEAAGIKKQNPKKVPAVKAKVVHTQNGQSFTTAKGTGENAVPTPPVSNFQSGYNYQRDKMISNFVLLGSISVLMTLLAIVFLIIFARNISWTAWQYIIGIVAVPIFLSSYVVIAAIISDRIEDKFVLDSYVYPLLISIAPLLIANGVLRLVFKADYEIIFYFVSGFLIVIFGGVGFLAEDELETGGIIASIVGVLLSIAGIILSIIF